MSPASRLILVADDEPSIRELLQSVFTVWGYPVRLCADGAAALAAASDPAISLLVVDHLMPQVTGLDVLRRLRASGCKTPAILMSGHFPKEAAAVCRELGDVDQLGKPFSLAELKAVVTARLSPGKA